VHRSQTISLLLSVHFRRGAVDPVVFFHRLGVVANTITSMSELDGSRQIGAAANRARHMIERGTKAFLPELVGHTVTVSTVYVTGDLSLARLCFFLTRLSMYDCASALDGNGPFSKRLSVEFQTM
jgi:hypothetical protein